jgi:Resolvase, N terminal domain
MALHLKPDHFVAYYRVSTAQQGRSGLGLEAQREAVRAFLDGSAGALAEVFTEVESGKNDARPQLAKALDACCLIGPRWSSEVPDDLRSSTHLVVRSVDGRRQIRCAARLACRQQPARGGQIDCNRGKRLGQLVGQRCRHLAHGVQSGKVRQVTAHLLTFDLGATWCRLGRSGRDGPDDLRDSEKLPGFVHDRRHGHGNKKNTAVFATKLVFIRGNRRAALNSSYRGE